MRQIPGFVNVAATAGLDRPEIRVVPKTDEAARYGITTDQISEAVASPRSATWRPTSPSSMPATGSCRSACSSTPTRAPGSTSSRR
jgi:hypothetical protein